MVAFIASVALMSCAARAAGPEDIAKLKFMTGTWKCIVHGGPSEGYVSYPTYSFSQDGSWMEEREAGKSGTFVDVQMWGYDAGSKRLVAHQFTPDGVFTKSVDGWVDGMFVGHRDDNNATIAVQPKDSKHCTWIITSADKSSVVKEVCSR